MMLTLIANWIMQVISHLGYGGVVLLMAIESACIPLPSEIILPFAGYLAFLGSLNLWGIAVAGATGSVLGSWLAYAAGVQSGRPFVERYGRYVLVSPADLDLADRWFARYGDLTILFGRLLPIVRTFIAFPAGVARMPIWRFSIYTFIGSFFWSLALAWLGMELGRHWQELGGWFHRFDFMIAAILLLLGFFYVRRHLRALRDS